MSRILTFLDNLKTHLAAGGSLLTEVEERHILILSGDDPEQEKVVDKHVQHHCMRSKGIGIVIYVDSGDNPNSGESGTLALEVSFEVMLFLHPLKFGKTYDPTKREALTILEDLLRHLHWASIEPVFERHYDRVTVESFEPIADDTYWAWNIPCKRRIALAASG